MSRLHFIRQRAIENRDPSILEVFKHVRWWSIFIVVLGPILGVLVLELSKYKIPDEVLHGDAKLMLGIFVLAAVYWVTGAIPPFATGVLVIGLTVFLVGLPASEGGWFHDHVNSGVNSWNDFVQVAAAPIIVLMLGGFVLSSAAHKHGLDRVMAVTFIKPFGSRRPIVLLGIMLITANFSMWMSNTATAAFMIVLIMPLIDKCEADSPVRKSFVLAIPLAANIGGMGTPIGTPPNAIAFGALRAMGVDITFVGWMMFAIPLMLILLFVGWLFLLWMYPFRKDNFEFNWEEQIKRPGPEQWILYITFAVTISLWMTSAWTGIPIAPVAIIPIVVLTATRLIDRNDINSLDWDILLLMTGGLALGYGMSNTGLAQWMVDSVPVASLGKVPVIIAFCGTTLVFSIFMSNTAVANLLMPIALGLAATGTLGLAGGDGVMSADVAMIPLAAGVCVAFGASLAMALPVSTPPNAIAFATGNIEVMDLVKMGTVIGIAGIIFTTILCRYILV